MKRGLFETVREPRDVLIQLRLRTNVARRSLSRLRGRGIVAVDGDNMTPVGMVHAVTVVESLGDDVARAEKRGREAAKGKR